MDEIRLTDEETQQAIKFALIGKKAPEVTAEFLYRTVARAQLRKMDDRINPLVQEALNAVTPPATLCETAYDALTRLQQALRAAAEEELRG